MKDYSVRYWSVKIRAKSGKELEFAVDAEEFYWLMRDTVRKKGTVLWIKQWSKKPCELNSST